MGRSLIDLFCTGFNTVPEPIDVYIDSVAFTKGDPPPSKAFDRFADGFPESAFRTQCSIERTSGSEHRMFRSNVTGLPTNLDTQRGRAETSGPQHHIRQ